MGREGVATDGRADPRMRPPEIVMSKKPDNQRGRSLLQKPGAKSLIMPTCYGYVGQTLLLKKKSDARERGFRGIAGFELGGWIEAAGDGAGDEGGALFLQLLDQLPLLRHQPVNIPRLPVEKVRDGPLFGGRRKRNWYTTNFRSIARRITEARRSSDHAFDEGSLAKRVSKIRIFDLTWPKGERGHTT